MHPRHPSTSSSNHLIGRERELRELHESLARAAANEPQVILVEGVTGVGKSTLLTHVSRSAADRGFNVVKAVGTTLSADVPFGLVQQMFEPLLSELPSERVEAFGRSKRYAYGLVMGDPTALDLDGAMDMHRALQGLLLLIGDLARRTPTCFVVEDLQWADQASVLWLLHLCRRAEQVSLLVLAARTTGISPKDPLLVSELRESGTVVKVETLSPSEVGQLVTALLGRESSPELTSACYDATGGNPFLLSHLLPTLRGRSEVDAVSGSRMFRFGQEELGEAILARINRQAPSLLPLVRAVALLDRPSMTLAAAVSGQPLLETADAARQLAGAGLLAVEGEQISLEPSILASAVQRSLTHAERDAMHARAAQYLYARGAAAALIAVHLTLTSKPCGSWATEVLRLAAVTVMADGDPACATKYLRKALKEDLDSSTRLEVLIQVGLTESHYDPSLAAQHLGEILGQVEAPEDLAKVAYRLAQSLYFAERQGEVAGVCTGAIRRLGSRDPDATDLLELALRKLSPTSTPGEVDWNRFDATWHRENLYARRVASLISEQTSAQGMSLDLSRDTALAALTHGVGRLLREPLEMASAITSLIRADDTELALYHCNRAVEEAYEQGLWLSSAFAWTLRSRVHHQRGDLHLAETDARRALKMLDDLGTPPGQFAFVDATETLVRALVDMHELDAAEEAMARIDLPEELPMNWHHSALLYTRGKLRLALGDPKGALEDELLCGERFLQLRAFNPAIRPWRGRAVIACLAMGDRSQAMRLALDDLAFARKWSTPAAVGRAMHSVGRAATGADAVTWLKDGANLLAETGGRQLWASCLLDLGIARWELGQRDAARKDISVAAELARQCGARGLLMRLSLLDPDAISGDNHISAVEAPENASSRLTPHERRIATLVVEGTTNTEIARRLSVSRRTVEYHLTNIYRKLGIQRRAQLSGALARTLPGRRI